MSDPAIATASTASLGPGPAVPEPQPERGNVSAGQKLFVDHCAGCHQDNGQGAPRVAAALAGLHTRLPEGETADTGGAQYDFEPDEETILEKLLPQALAIQVYRALLESAAGEHGARMTAMDNATRNAGDMIKRLSLNYNRARQANITKELIEIISGAEAV